jgi:hypothetical protein
MVSSGLLRRVARRNNPEDTILHSHRRENLKSYKYIVDCSYLHICVLQVVRVYIICNMFCW